MIFASLCAILFFYSCKKDTGPAPQTVATARPAYLPAKVGNYWVYEAYTVDSMNVETDLHHTDSMWIDRDTVMNGATFHHFATINANSLFSAMSSLGNNWAEDSAGCIWPAVFKRYWFDPAYLNDTLYTDSVGWGYVFYKVPTNFSNDVTTAGSYSGLSIATLIRRENPPRNYPRPAAFENYTQGVGLVHFKNSFSGDPMGGYVWRLVRYHLN